MISGPVTSRTIPELLARAASRDPDGSWLRADAADWAGPGRRRTARPGRSRARRHRPP